MSGGSMDYLCYKIENQLSYVDDLEIKDLMTDLAELMHDLEWCPYCGSKMSKEVK